MIRKPGLTRREVLRSGVTFAGFLASACGSAGSLDAGDRPALSEKQRRILDQNTAVASAKTQPNQSQLPGQPLKVHPLWSSFGPTRNHYRRLVERAGSFGDAAPRLELANFRQATEGRTLGESVSLMADTEPLDILIFPAESLEDLDDNDVLVPLDKVADIGEAIKHENYWPGILEAGQIKGRQMAIPLQLGPWLLMYRRKRLDEHGIRDPNDWPWNAAQFSENASRLTQVNARKDDADRYGFLQIVSENAAATPIPPSWVWMISAGSKMPNRERNEEALHQPAALAGLNVMDELINRHRSVYKVSASATARQLRALMKDERVSMMSFPVNSGWFLSSWRDALSDGFELAALPGGQDRRTPTEIHMMVGASSWSKYPEYAMASLVNLYRSVGQQLFPSAMRADAGMITTVEPVLHDRDSIAIQAALEKTQPINLSKVEKELITAKLDLAILHDKTPLEEAAKSAAEALREFREAKGNPGNGRPAPPSAAPGTG